MRLPLVLIVKRHRRCLIGCLHDPANVLQTSSKCIQNTLVNAGRLLDRVNTLLVNVRSVCKCCDSEAEKLISNLHIIKLH